MWISTKDNESLFSKKYRVFVFKHFHQFSWKCSELLIFFRFKLHFIFYTPPHKVVRYYVIHSIWMCVSVPRLESATFSADRHVINSITTLQCNHLVTLTGSKFHELKSICHLNLWTAKVFSIQWRPKFTAHTFTWL